VFVFCAAFIVNTNVPLMLCNRRKLVLINVEKSALGFFIIFRERNAFVDKFANLVFIHNEYFRWYNRLASNLFVGFFINRYKLSIYRFC